MMDNGQILDMNGNYHLLNNFPHKIWEKPKVKKNIKIFANVYKYKSGNEYFHIYDTKDEADKYANLDRIACIELTGTYEE